MTQGRHRFRALLLALVWMGCAWPAFAQTAVVTGNLLAEGAPSSEDADTDLSGAAVWLVPIGPHDSMVGPTPKRFEILQEDKRFFPRLLPIPVGSTVDFPNLDPFFHNVFSLFEGKRFDLGLYEAGASRSTVFDRPGVSYIFCNIHPEMVAIIVAIESDLSGQTNAAGRFRIEGVPAGEYRLHVWHERWETGNETTDVQPLSVATPDVEVPPLRVTNSSRVLEDHTNKFGLEYESSSDSSAPYLLPR